jgi:hypothetical protein
MPAASLGVLFDDRRWQIVPSCLGGVNLEAARQSRL